MTRRGHPRPDPPRHRIERLRPERLGDYLDDILEIEGLCFPHPWGAAAFRDDLCQMGASLDVLLTGGRSALGGGPRVAAFCCMRQLVDEAHVMQIATHPDLQRRGYASSLLVHALLMARRSGCRAAVLEVRPSNVSAVSVYEKQGFRQVGVRRRYYADNGEDALIMRCELL